MTTPRPLDDKVVIVTRASEGLGVAIAADITDEDGRSQVVTAAMGTFGRVDVLVNNAGTAVAGAACPRGRSDRQRLVDLGDCRVRQVRAQLVRREQGWPARAHP